MSSALTAETALKLTERWHDQTLDLKRLTFDESRRQCVFRVTERKRESPAVRKFFIQKGVLQYCTVTLSNVTRVQILDAENEVELYIDEVENTPTCFRIKCVNGSVELTGEHLEISCDTTPANEGEVSLVTPIGDISWRPKQDKTRS